MKGVAGYLGAAGLKKADLELEHAFHGTKKKKLPRLIEAFALRLDEVMQAAAIIEATPTVSPPPVES